MTKTIDILLSDSNLEKVYTWIQHSGRIADNTSSELLCGRFKYIWVNCVNKPTEALAALLVISFIVKENNEIATQKFREHLAQMCYNYNYEGKWRVVQEVLELPIQRPYYIITTILQRLNVRELKGNILRVAALLLNCVEERQFDVSKEYRQKLHKVKKPQRKRGYDDKGYLRPSHEWTERYPFPGEAEQREDRRLKANPARQPYYTIPDQEWRKYE